MAVTGCALDQSVVVPDTSPPADSATGRDTGTGQDSAVARDSATPTDSAPAADSAPPVGDDDILIEAEDADRTRSLDGVHDWLFDSMVDDYRGTGAMFGVPPSPRIACDPGALDTCGAKMEFDMTLPAPGDYVVHLRAQAPGSGRDSVYVQFTGAALENRDLDDGGGFLWNRTRPVTLPAGPTTLTIWIRENGSHLDQLFITATGSTPP